KPEVAEFQRIDEHIDHPNSIAFVDPILKAFWQQRRLPAIQSRHKAWHQIPRRFSRGSWHGKSFHTAWVKLRRTQYEDMFSASPSALDMLGAVGTSQSDHFRTHALRKKHR